MFFFFYETATSEIYPYVHLLALHDVLPIWPAATGDAVRHRLSDPGRFLPARLRACLRPGRCPCGGARPAGDAAGGGGIQSGLGNGGHGARGDRLRRGGDRTDRAGRYGRTPAGRSGHAADRKSVGEGKGVSGRVEHGGRRIIKKKKKKN